MSGLFPKGMYAWAWFWLAGGGLAVAAYNSWALCCGQCSWNDLLQIPWWGGLLLGVNLAAASVLVFLRLRQRQIHSDSNCPGCRASAGRDWVFCPLCGRPWQRRSLFKQGSTIND